MDMQEQFQAVRERLLASARPLFIFDDDPDGLASFLILYKLVRAGKGIPLKGAVLDERFAPRVNEYSPDLIVVLDKAVVAQEFFDAVEAPCIWLDHHEPQKSQNVLYVNPRLVSPDNNLPTSHLAYEVAQENPWLAVVGVFSDWQVPSKRILDDCRKECADILPEELNNPESVDPAKIFSFNLKGRMTDVLSSIKILTRIQHPFELLQKQHAQAKLVMKRYELRKQEYDAVLSSISVDDKDTLLLYIYEDTRNSYTTDLSNELLFRHPDKLIIIARKSSEQYKCSLRASHYHVRNLLAAALDQVGGDGGGHEKACGAVVPVDVFDDFISFLRAQKDNFKTE